MECPLDNMHCAITNSSWLTRPPCLNVYIKMIEWYSWERIQDSIFFNSADRQKNDGKGS
jgi:hypothetical protein